MNYTAKGAAKINLAIDVLRKRQDGYHEVAMIMQSVALYDTINVSSTNDGIQLTTNSLKIPRDHTNIAYKTAEYLRTKYNVKMGAIINIDKKIPVAAGLAGGSTDAAITLTLLNKLWDLRLTKAELMEAGKKLGADVSFCIQGGTALAEGLGEKLTVLSGMPECHILLAKPDMDISTQMVYQSLNLDKIEKRPDMKAMIKAIETGDLKAISENMVNVLETVTIEKCPEIQEIKERLMLDGALGSMMSGSGPTVFGLFDSAAAAYNAYEGVKDMVKEVFVVKTVDGREK